MQTESGYSHQDVQTPSYQRTWLWLVLLLLTTWLGARGLNADAIWYDEYRSLFYAGGAYMGPIPLPEVWTRVALYGGSAQVPGYFSLLWAWGRLVGWTEFATRALSLFFGLLAVAWTYRLGALALPRRGGLYAAAILGVSAFFIHYLHELRVYTLLALMTAFTVWAYQRVATAKHPPSRRLQLALLLGVAVSLYSHYLAALTLAALGLYHLIFMPKNRRWWQTAIIMGLGGALFLPWAGVLIEGVSSKSRDAVSANVGEVVSNIAHSLSNDSLLLLAAVVALAILARQRGVRLAGFVGLALLALGLILNRWLRIGDTRYYMALWPLFALVAGGGILYLQRLGVKPALGLAVWMVVGVVTTFRPDFIGDYAGVKLIASIFPWQVAAKDLGPYAQAGDLVTFTMPDSVIAYQQWEIASYYLHDLDARYPLDHTIIASDVGLRFGLQHLAESPQRVWSVYSQPRPALLADFESALNRDYIRCGTVIGGPEVTLDLYAACQVCCPPDDPERDSLYRFGGDILITGIEPLAQAVHGSLDVRLGWAVPDAVPRYTYSVALHVEDGAGNLAAQADYGLPEQRFSCYLATIDVSSLPPGEYRLLAAVYAWESGERLPGTALATGETSDRVLLGTFEVTG